jgi:hypothetical protein
MSVAASARLLQPQELHQKTLATVGYDWRPFRDANYWTNELAFMYAGFDGGEVANTLNGSLSPLLTQIPERMALEGVCEVVRNDFRRSSAERRLFPTVSGGDIPSPNAGAVVRQLWTGIAGTAVNNLTADPRFPAQPDQVETLSSLEAGQFGDNYGQRLQAYIVAPASGNYTFWVAGDDNAQLWLSSDTSEAGKQLIAQVPVWTNVGEWTKFPEQRSAAISLQAGQQYYLEVLHKEGGGGDHLAVAWEGPGLSMQVIGADHLVVFDPNLANLSEDRIKSNIQYLHWVLLGETLAADDAELERTYQLFKAVWDARAGGDSTGVTCSLNDQNDSNYAQRAWVAVLVYLMGDPHYLYE